MVTTQNLWPNFSSITSSTPQKLMQEQAAYLKDKTQGKIYARVEKDNVNGLNDKIGLSFKIVAPGLGNYRYTLFYVQHDINIYPLQLMHGNSDLTVNNSDELVEAMSKIFNSEDTIKKISTLLSYE